MSETVRALAGLQAVAALFRHKPRLPAAPANETPSAADAGPLPAPTAKSIEQIRLDMVRALQHGDAASLPRRLLRDAPLVFWHGTPPIIGMVGLLDAYLAQAASRPSWLRTLIEAWLRDFGPDQPQIARVGNFIAERIGQIGTPGLHFWSQAHRNCAMFDAATGPARLAAALLEAEEWTAILKGAGMDEPLRVQGGYFRETLCALLARLPQVVRSPAAQARWPTIQALLEVEEKTQDRMGRVTVAWRLRAQSLRAEIARSCLRPWLEPPPPTLARGPVLRFLLRHNGDPRLQPARWNGIGERESALVRGWLAARTLEAFLNFIRQQAGNDRSWQYREAFWRACLHKKPDADVWIVLGQNMALQAVNQEHLKGSFGRMSGDANASRQAVLLIRIGDIVLCEWSHVGPIRAWKENNPLTPKLYILPETQHYKSSSLTQPSLPFPNHPSRGVGGSRDSSGLRHQHGETGLWQGCAAELLRQRLGILLLPIDYMPQFQGASS